MAHAYLYQALRMTPLAWHTYSGNADIVNLLLDNGAEINADFDASYREAKVTAFDIISTIVSQSSKDASIEGKFMNTLVSLKNRGGKPYHLLEKSLKDDIEDEENETGEMKNDGKNEL